MAEKIIETVDPTEQQEKKKNTTDTADKHESYEEQQGKALTKQLRKLEEMKDEKRKSLGESLKNDAHSDYATLAQSYDQKMKYFKTLSPGDPAYFGTAETIQDMEEKLDQMITDKANTDADYAEIMNEIRAVQSKIDQLKNRGAATGDGSGGR